MKNLSENEIKEIGGVREELDRDDKVRNESKALQAEIEKQRKVFEKWERLNNLIGQKRRSQVSEVRSKFDARNFDYQDK